MKEVHSHLYVGSNADYLDMLFQEGWGVLHACKEPYHRNALGYTGRAAPKLHPEYLFALRGDRCALNLVDADDPAFIPPAVIEAALGFIDGHMAVGHKVLVHCNQGQSRAPSVALAWLAGERAVPQDHEAAIQAFTKLYPDYRPNAGVAGYLKANWSDLWHRKQL